MEDLTYEDMEIVNEEAMLLASLLLRSEEDSQRFLDRTRQFTSQIQKTYHRLGHIERQLQQLLAGGASGSLQPYIRPKQHLSPLENLLIIYHPVLDNIVDYLTSRDLVKLGRVSQGLRQVIYSNRIAWKNLNFGVYWHPQTYHAMTSEMLIRIVRRIPLDNLHSLVLDRTDVTSDVVTAIMAEARKTLVFVSIQDCQKITLKKIFNFFCEESKFKYSQLALKQFHMNGVPGIMTEEDDDFIDSRTSLGRMFNTMIAHFIRFNIETDVGPCVGGFANCQGIRYRFQRAQADDRVMGAMLMEQCWKCCKESKHFYCHDCMEDRECILCERHICEDCEAGRPEGIIKRNNCTACQYHFCDQCYEYEIHKFRDCKCIFCPFCMKNHEDDVPTSVGSDNLFLKLDNERIRVTKTMCDHCGVDKCKDCWRKGSVQLRPCIRCPRTVCENCGIGVACDDCNACICDDCLSVSGVKVIPPNKNWFCDHCSFSIEPPQAEKCVEEGDNNKRNKKGKQKGSPEDSEAKLKVVDIRTYWKRERSGEIASSPSPIHGIEDLFTSFFYNGAIRTIGAKHNLEEDSPEEGRPDKRVRLEDLSSNGGEGSSSLGSSLH